MWILPESCLIPRFKEWKRAPAGNIPFRAGSAYNSAGYIAPEYAGKPFSVNGRSYLTAEQYMMSEMALLFKDLHHYSLIMEEPSPKKCKDLGRLVSGFESTTWDNALREIIFHGNLGKFQNDIVLVNALLETENAVLIEASPYDGIYGAGLTESDLLNSDGSLKVQP